MNKGTTKSALYVNQVDLRITHYLSLFLPICQCWFLSSTDLVQARVKFVYQLKTDNKKQFLYLIGWCCCHF